MKKQIKNEIMTSGFVMMRCPFCMEEMKHEINFKCYGFNTQIHQQEVHFAYLMQYILNEALGYEYDILEVKDENY